MNTEMGAIAGMLDEIEEEQTPLQKRLDQVGRTIGIGCILICARRGGGRRTARRRSIRHADHRGEFGGRGSSGRSARHRDDLTGAGRAPDSAPQRPDQAAACR